MEKIIEELINSLTDDQFLEFHEKVKKEAELIKKQKRLNEIDQKFRDKSIKCPNCQSFYCVKNGHNPEGKQKYLCKKCRASFDAFRDHFTYWSHLNYEQWNLLIQISLLGQSSKMISHFIKTSPKTAWYNRQKIMKSKQLENTQLKFKTLNGQIKIDETFIKEIHKGNFKDKFDKRKIHLDSFSTNTKCCVQMAVDSNNNIYVKSTNTKRLQKQWIIENINKQLIKENSIIISDMQPLYLLVAKQTNSILLATKTSTNPDASYRKLNKISKLQSNIKESLIHYHGLGFTNIQNYLNLWKWKYQHKGLTPNQQSSVLYFNV
ncbi:IS1/IS1595 family N-terminal zinc-binding domain-containing protein [Spiroplasma endosymbiont of Poecilobothrus nobilitatus]|uniref:IS1/IS1595 family N-terminal zinc-binding domain-containing protein n=2 Tax=Spiroplasma endosymbiont of Poecilobothrus nobilitatus TaxID=1209220 RepID=UPI00313D894B